MPEYTKRQTQIIEAAIDIIATEGIQNLTVKNLSVAIGVSEPALYRHCQNKQEIIASILNYFAQDSRYHLTHVLRSKESALEKIEVFLKYHLETFSNRPALAAVIFSEGIFQNDPRLAKTVLKIMDQSQQTVLQIILSDDKRTLRGHIPPRTIDYHYYRFASFPGKQMVFEQVRVQPFTRRREAQAFIAQNSFEKRLNCTLF